MQEGYIGLVREVSFFTNNVRDEAIDKLRFEGSNDDFVTVTELKAVGEILEGWNTYDVSDLMPAFNLTDSEALLLRTTHATASVKFVSWATKSEKTLRIVQKMIVICTNLKIRMR